jgi:hypothetical protein
MNKANKTLLVLASAMLLAGCGNNNNSSSKSMSDSSDEISSDVHSSNVSSNDSASPSSETVSSSSETASSSDVSSSEDVSSESSSESSSVEPTTYKIVDRASGNGIELTFDKERAAKGETVTITVAIEEGYTLVAIYANKVACTKVDDTTYTFVMGDAAVAITCELSVNGDVTIKGDVAVPLYEQEDGTYKGTFTAESSVSFTVSVNGVSSEYGFMAVDLNSSYADIDQPSSGKGISPIVVAGNAVYEITFDASKEKPIVIYRTGILHAPSSVSEIDDFFCGSYAGRNVLDSGAYNVRNLNHVDYTSSRAGINYSWDLYENSSFATVTDKLTDEVSYVYKNVSDDVYTVVDEYAETIKDSDGLLDRTKEEDTVKFSGRYSIVDEVSNKCYEKTLAKAKADIATPSHELHSINSEIQFGYYIGFNIEDELKACDRVIEGVKNDDGTFTTTIKSWKNYEDDSAVDERYQYETSIEINADGTISSVSYYETYYTKENWSFNNSDADNGGSAIAGKSPTVKQKSSVKYTYGAAKTGTPDFDVSPYFIASIDNVTVNSREDKTKAEGHVKYKEIIDECRRDPHTVTVDENSASGYTSLLKLSYSPSTALDAWEYGIVSSDEPSIIGPNVNIPSQWIGLGAGSSEVTIGNHSTNEVTAKKVITVDDAPLPTGYNVWAYGNETDTDVPSSSKVSIQAGRRMKVYLFATYNTFGSPIVSCSDDRVKLELSGSVKPTVSTISTHPAWILTIDASEISTETKLSFTITVDDERRGSAADAKGFTASTIALEVRPGTKSLLPSSIEGTTWTAHDYSSEVTSSDPRYMSGDFVPATLSFTSEVAGEFNGLTYKKGALTATYNGSTKTHDFYYYYGIGDSGSMVLLLRHTDDDVFFDIGGTTLEEYGILGAWATSSTWGGADDSETDYIFGYPEEDGEAVEYEWFTLVE